MNCGYLICCVLGGSVCCAHEHQKGCKYHKLGYLIFHDDSLLFGETGRTLSPRGQKSTFGCFIFQAVILGAGTAVKSEFRPPNHWRGFCASASRVSRKKNSSHKLNLYEYSVGRSSLEITGIVVIVLQIDNSDAEPTAWIDA
jgi:hypothetical protein